jgi:hypothetical protein
MSDKKSNLTDTTRTHVVETGEEILATLYEMLVTRLEEDLDLEDPDNLDVYNKSKVLQEYIEQILKETENG